MVLNFIINLLIAYLTIYRVSSLDSAPLYIIVEWIIVWVSCWLLLITLLVGELLLITLMVGELLDSNLTTLVAILLITEEGSANWKTFFDIKLGPLDKLFDRGCTATVVVFEFDEWFL